MMPAFHPGAWPRVGGCTADRSIPLRLNTHAMTELEFHISPALQLVATPYRSGKRWKYCQHATRGRDIVRDECGTRDRARDVGDRSVAPAPDLVPEDAPTPGPSRSHRTRRDHPTSFAARIRDRRLLDDEPALGHVDEQGGVVQLATWATVHRRGDGLEQPTADAHDVRAGAQGDPIQLDGPALTTHVVHGASQPGAHGCR